MVGNVGRPADPSKGMRAMVGTRRAWCLAGLLSAAPLAAQELQPRALQNAPIGTTFALVATGWSRGNLLVDPALPITDAQADVWSVTTGLVRAINMFGLGAQVGIVAPFITGRWEAVVAGADTATSRTGFADPRLQLAVNFFGAPALTRTQMRDYRQSTVLGMQLWVTVPVGQYDPEKLVNLGSHRWSIQPRLGVSRALGSRVTLEGYAGATFFTTNSDYYGGQVLKQDPFFEAQGHVIYVTRNPGVWFAGSFGYGWGGASTIDGTPQDGLSNVRGSVVARLPLWRAHSLKLAYINGLTTKLGTDFDTFQLGYQYVFGGKP